MILLLTNDFDTSVLAVQKILQSIDYNYKIISASTIYDNISLSISSKSKIASSIWEDIGKTAELFLYFFKTVPKCYRQN